MATRSPLYDSDFYAWSREQADLLRAGRLAEADIENIAGEIDSMGRTEKRALISRLTLLLLHLLKWRFQPGKRGASCEASIRVQRYDVDDHLGDNPSLRPLLPQSLASAYRKARQEAVAETGLPEATFPQACPWTVEETLDEGFWRREAGLRRDQAPAGRLGIGRNITTLPARQSARPSAPSPVHR